MYTRELYYFYHILRWYRSTWEIMFLLNNAHRTEISLLINTVQPEILPSVWELIYSTITQVNNHYLL